MNRFAAIAILLFAAVFQLAAQNNPYEIDDACYPLFAEADRQVGKDGFEQANARLLEMAIAKDDTRAQTLYYVERLKDLTRRLRPVNPSTIAQDAQVIQYMEELQDLALEFGYKEYFYYAFELAHDHFYSHEKIVRTMELIEEMKRKAEREKDEYVRWMAARYLVSIYVNQNDPVSAKSHIMDALRIYSSTSNPIIRRHPVARLYCDLADTYPIGHDSVAINIQLAQDACVVHMDSLRVRYCKAKLAAFQKDLGSYRYYRDSCLADPRLSDVSRTAEVLFRNIDAIVFDRDPSKIDVSGMSTRLREVKYVANIAEKYGYKDEAFALEKQLVAFEESTLSRLNLSKVAELDARLADLHMLGNTEKEPVNVSRTLVWLDILVIVVLLGSIVFLYLSVRRLSRTNRHLREINEKVRLADAAKTRFVQNMSHEVRTPLNAIVGFSQLLALPDGSFSPAEKDEFAGHIINNTKMLTMLLDDILNVSSMDSGNYRISYEDGEVNFIAQAAISSTEHRLQPGVRMYYEPESAEPFHFRTDPRRVQQVLINLLTNSCKHTAEGEIKLSSSMTAREGYVTYAVTDTGSGVPASEAEKIFDRFTKLNDFVQGTGLGLSICRDIADRMQARVYLDTSYQGPRGARFVFEVPVAPAEEFPARNRNNETKE
ncbi:MAG: HAMP domain-containing histidine kinase [Bacteroidales bacterium]|nr:HAMP domain-containing histidine kinase [Bacteroidales bacterium]